MKVQMSKDLVYLASPYSHVDEFVRLRRFEDACHAAAVLMSRGMLIFCPIAHTHPIAVAGDLPLGWDFWQRYDRTMLAACGRMIVLKLDGWEESKGIAGEIAIMGELGRPVEYIDPSELACDAAEAFR